MRIGDWARLLFGTRSLSGQSHAPPPDSPSQIWGYLCCHYAIRSLMTAAATHSGHDPDRVSFVAALRITRQAIAHPGAFTPDPHSRDSPGWLHFLSGCSAGSTPPDARGPPPRVIKLKMPK